ncbi:MAG: polysaccharide ABC transporter ATP-binding protein, partial [Solirubrobacteraceae bacterium]
ARSEVEERIEEIIAFSELGHFIEAPIKTYSSGMLVRLGFSVAAHIDADVLLIDEVLAVGDESFQRKCMRRIAERIEEGTTVVLVSHSPATIDQACRRALVLDAGKPVYDGPTADALRFYHRLLGLEGRPAPVLRGKPLDWVVLQEARLEGADGRPRHIFAAGEPLRVVLALETLEALTAGDLEILLEVRDAPGGRVFATGHRITPGLGAQTLAFEIPQLTLLGGDYDVTVGLRTPGDQDPPAVGRELAFSMVQTDGAEGVVDLRGTWSLAGTPVEVGP